MKKFILPLLLSASFASNAGDLDRSPRYNLYQDYNNLLNSGADSNDIYELNKLTLKEIYNYSFERNSKRVSGISKQQGQDLIEFTQNHFVTGYVSSNKYDPTGDIGFCFGRALFIHLELLRHGVQKQAIKKAFAIGPMYSGGMYWQFHVTTIVQGNDGEWLAIDPYVGHVVKLEEWFDYLTAKSRNGKLRFYLSDPAKIGPADIEYNLRPGGLLEPQYNNYFADMLQYFRKNPVSCKEKFK